MPITEYYRGTTRVVEDELLPGLSQTERTTFLYTGDDPFPGLRYVGTYDLQPCDAQGQYGIPDSYAGPVVLMRFPKLTRRPSKGWRPQLKAIGNEHATRMIRDIVVDAIYPPIILGPFQDSLMQWNCPTQRSKARLP